LKLTLKPDSEIADVVAWFSAISCAQFIYPGQDFLQGHKVTILATELLTPEDAYRLVLGALESVGLTVEPAGKFLRIVNAGSRNAAGAR
jgi:general secretion pathway protein D